MILKLCRPGDVVRLVECSEVYWQPCAVGIDVEAVQPKGPLRFLVGNDDEGWERAYVVEGGKTVDTIRYIPAIHDNLVPTKPSSG